MDYGKFKYEQKRKVSKAKRGQSVLNLKEVKFRPKTEPHDFVFKMNNVKKFLLQGRKVKIAIIFKGREIIHIDIGRKMLQKIISEVKSYITLENTSKMEGKQLIAILSPVNSKLDTL
jgi:translation initiation factor IF-3